MSDNLFHYYIYYQNNLLFLQLEFFVETFWGSEQEDFGGAMSPDDSQIEISPMDSEIPLN